MLTHWWPMVYIEELEGSQLLSSVVFIGIPTQKTITQ